MDRPPAGSRGGLAGQRITLHRKKFHFCIIHIILKKIDVNLTEKNLDLVNFVNFADAPRGVGDGTPTPPIGEPCSVPCMANLNFFRGVFWFFG